MEFTNRRYVVEQEFMAWRPTLRDETQVPMKVESDVFANLDVDGDLIQFELDTVKYETDRSKFLNSTRACV